MKIEINEEGILFCNGIICDPVAMYDSCSECGGCPFISKFNEFLKVYLENAW